MSKVICNKAGKTASCGTCPHGKPHDEIFPDKAGYVIQKTFCVGERASVEVKCFPVKK